jgi:sugar/nucleoside kinase (ribokinase family)
VTVPRVFGFGSATLAFRLAGDPAQADILATDCAAHGAGNMADSLVQAARLGAHACWLGKLGDDWIGHQILESLEDEAIDCSAVLVDPAACSPFRVVVDGPTEERTVRLPNAAGRLSIQDVQFLADQIDAGEWAMVEIGELPLALVHAFCARVKRRDARLMLTVDIDPVGRLGADPVDVQMLFSQADLLVPNPVAIRPFCDTHNPPVVVADLARRYRCLAVLRDAEGAWFCDASGFGDEQPADLVDPVDASGSEASFRGALLAALAFGEGLPAALALASQCAARTGACLGNRISMPRSTELDLDRPLGGG